VKSNHSYLWHITYIQRLSASYRGIGLRFVNLQEESGGAIVELAIEGETGHTQEELKQLQTELEQAGKQIVEYQRLALTEKESRLRLEGRLEHLNADFDKVIQRPTYHVSGQAGAVGDNSHSHDLTLKQTQAQPSAKRIRAAKKASKK
jgi:hypothetical protein